MDINTETDTEYHFAYAMGYMGIVFALVLANLGAAYGTAKSGVGICAMGVMKPGVIVKGVIPVIMAGILGIYGLIVSVIDRKSVIWEVACVVDWQVWLRESPSESEEKQG